MNSVSPEGRWFQVEYDIEAIKESKLNVGVRSIFCIIEKVEKGWWKNPLRGSEKPPRYLKINWDKWVDEDETDGMCGMKGMGDMDMSSLMQGMGGMGGMDMSGMGDMGDMGNESYDDDNELEKPEKVEDASKDAPASV